MEDIKQTALTFEKAKDLIAVKYGCKNWIELKVNIALQREFREEHKINESIALDQAAELHTMSLTSQLSSALNSYNLECKRNDQLQEEVDKLRKQNSDAAALLLDSVSKQQYIEVLYTTDKQKEEILLYREALRVIQESFAEYCKHRKDKGTAIAKINAWNHLLFRINDSQSALSKFQPK